MEPACAVSPALEGGFFTTEPHVKGTTFTDTEYSRFFFSFSTLFRVSPSYPWIEPIHRFLYLWWVLESIPHGYWGTNVYHTTAFCLARFLLRKLLIILLIIPCMYWVTSFLLLSRQLCPLEFHYSVSGSLWFSLQKVHLHTCISNLYLSSNFGNSLPLFLLFLSI